MMKDLDSLRAQYQEKLRASVEKIRQVDLGGPIQRISLFGSYARGRADLCTDLDILLVAPSEKPFVERLKEIRRRLSLPVDYDVFWYTPEEFDRMKNRPFLKHALKDEVVLYEA